MSNIMQLCEVRDWLKSFNLFEHYYIGKLDQKQDKSLGVYQLQASGQPIRAFNGLSSYSTKKVSLLIHWNKNARETEEIASELFEKLLNIERTKIGEYQVYFIDMLVPEAQNVGTDEKGIFEEVIEIEIYYKKERTKKV